MFLQNTEIETAPEPVPDTVIINGLGQFASCWGSVEAKTGDECEGGKLWNFTLAPEKTCVWRPSQRARPLKGRKQIPDTVDKLRLFCSNPLLNR
jgi:hypothetical protein